MRRERTVPESVTAMVGAERVVRRRETVVHPMEDWDLFVRTLANPPQPNRMLKAAKVASTRLRHAHSSRQKRRRIVHCTHPARVTV